LKADRAPQLKASVRLPFLMSANIPMVRRIAWLYTVLHVLVMFGLILLLWRIQFPNNFDLAMFYGALGYLIYSFGSKALLLRHHRRGIRLSKLKLFREAIPEFLSSYSFLSKHSWVDKYRFITMLDSSAVPYREMALCNIAFSYAQVEENSRAEEYYRKALEEFSQSVMAKSGLEHVESRERK
jgi:tetratricopeptide (TPR) repeat protein